MLGTNLTELCISLTVLNNTVFILLTQIRAGWCVSSGSHHFQTGRQLISAVRCLLDTVWSHWSRLFPLQQGRCPFCLQAVSRHYTLTTRTENHVMNQPAVLLCLVHPLRKGFTHMSSLKYCQRRRTAWAKSCEVLEQPERFHDLCTYWHSGWWWCLISSEFDHKLEKKKNHIFRLSVKKNVAFRSSEMQDHVTHT